MKVEKVGPPDNTAVRTSLWRALHTRVDAKPHIFEDEVGLKLIGPAAGWQQRPDMKFTRRLRAAIVARARFIEDLVVEQAGKGVTQYVILGAGLDTFAQRRMDIAVGIGIFEIDRPETLAWKQQRLVDTGFDIPGYLHFVPVDFEASSWFDALLKAGFDPGGPAVVACTGVSLYLTGDAIISTLECMAKFAPGSTLAMTFYLPLHLLDEEDRMMQELADKGAREAGTPFVSFFAPDEILLMAKNAGLRQAELVLTKDIERLYFKERADGLLPASGEVFLLAKT